MPSKFTLKPDKRAAAFIRTHVKSIRENGKKERLEKEEIDKEVRKFKKIYLTVLVHAMKKMSYSREEAEEYAINTYIDKSATWAVRDEDIFFDDLREIRLPVMIDSLDLSEGEIISLVESMQKKINIFCCK
jgi:hypothetical protein